MRISDWSSDVCSSDLWFEGADGAFQLHAIGDDVVADAAVDGAKAQHQRRAREVGAAADQGLRRAHDLRGGDDRVDAAPGFGTVGLAADHLDREAVRSGHRSEEHTSELQSLMRISYAV